MKFERQKVCAPKRHTVENLWNSHFWITFLSEISWKACQLLMTENWFSVGKTKNIEFYLVKTIKYGPYTLYYVKNKEYWILLWQILSRKIHQIFEHFWNFWKTKLDKKCATSTQNTVDLKYFLQEVYRETLSSKIIKTFSLALWILIFF